MRLLASKVNYAGHYLNRENLHVFRSNPNTICLITSCNMHSPLVSCSRDGSRGDWDRCAGWSCVCQLCPRGLHGLEEALAQQIQFSTAEHLPFQHFQAVN